ncbi:MAG: class I SAM-dependent methyltransferase, partial [Chloroflexi bacterium]|nr:class I SAM-dependent methyltransferase [Chloroflexota bacterium]
MPLANALLTREMLGEPEPVYPLEVIFCEDCALLQLKETVPPEALFREYNYLSSFSDTMLKHAHESAEALIACRGLSGDSLVIEIASNDGYMLSAFASQGIPVLGIDPARNVASVAEAKGVPTLVEFFTESLAHDVRRKQGAADLILANNVLAHVPEIVDVLRGVRALLKDGGVLVLETPYVRDLVEKLEFDTIYHEHVFYYSMTAIEALLRRAGLTPLSVERISIHGGSIRVTAGVSGRGKPDGSVERLLSEEDRAGMSGLPFYSNFAQRVPNIGEQLVTLLQQVKSSGWTAAGYGAAAKGSTLLNHFGIGKESLDYVVDRS